MKKLWLPALLLCAALLPSAANAMSTTAPGQKVTITERHAYFDGETQHLIPQNGAEKRHVLSKGSPLTLKSAQFLGFELVGGEAERRLVAQVDETVLFLYTRTTAPVTATIRVDTTAASNLGFLRERLLNRRISLRMRQETLATQVTSFPETGDELVATVDFEPVYTHTVGGSPISYRVLMANLPEGFVAYTEGLTLVLRPVSRILTVRHLYEGGEGMTPIPQAGAEYDITCQYGDTLLIPNQDFDGFLTDQESPNLYVPAVSMERELSFFHRRRMGVYGQIEIDTSLSNRPTRLLRLVERENPVLLTLDGKTVGSAVAQFSGAEPAASVSFPNVYTHTPEGVAISYTLSLVENPLGFMAHGDGATLILSPRPVKISVTHQYSTDPGMWESIPQEDATYTLQAYFGDALVVPGQAFPGFEEEPGDDRTLSQVTGEEEVFFQHVRAFGSLSCSLHLSGGPDTNRAMMMQELALAYFTATGGELPEEGVRVATELDTGENAYVLKAALPGVPTHSPAGEPYAYALTLRGFAPLSGILKPFAGIRPNVPVSADLNLPEVTVRCLLLSTENGLFHTLGPEDGAVVYAYPYGESVTIEPPEILGYTTDDAPLVLPFLREALEHTFHYQRTAEPTSIDTPAP